MAPRVLSEDLLRTQAVLLSVCKVEDSRAWFVNLDSAGRRRYVTASTQADWIASFPSLASATCTYSFTRVRLQESWERVVLCD